MIFLAETGIKDIEFEENLGKSSLNFSVPSSSFELDRCGNKMCGDLLAKRIKKIFSDLGYRPDKFNFTMRNEEWTKEKFKQANIDFKRGVIY